MKRDIRDTGFTLLELIVVLAGLGILSSLAIPNFVKLFDFNQIDEAKSLLNSAAADCLQKARRPVTDNTREVIDTSIISDFKIAAMGYKKDPSASDCTNFQLIPVDDNDTYRYKFGFSVRNGKLSKSGFKSSRDPQSIASCIGWAGEGCTADDKFGDLMKYLDTIKAAKTSCRENLDNWEANKMNPKESKRWDSRAEAGCPYSVPKDNPSTAEDESIAYKTSDSCTKDGCTADVWGLWDSEANKGNTYSSEAAYKEARKLLVGAKCDEAIIEKTSTNYTNTSKIGEQLFDKTGSITCDGDPYWFHKGTNAGDQKAWEILNYKANNPTGKQTLSDGSELYLCLGDEYKTEPLMKQCISNDEEAQCDELINERSAESKEGRSHGKFVANAGGAGRCSDIYWYCNGENEKTETAFNLSSCAKKDCDSIKRHKACNENNPTHPSCKNWATCMGYI